MTTIAISRPLLMVAGDSQWTTEDLKEQGPSKLRRYKDFIAGFCGEVNDIRVMAAWLQKRNTHPKIRDASAILLYRDGRITEINEKLIEHEVVEDYAAAGTGKIIALASMDTMKALGAPIDPRLAVRISSGRDIKTGGEVHSLRWKPCQPKT